MAYRIVYVDNGDVVAQESDHRAALHRLRTFVEEHPQLDGEIGIQEINDAGYPVGEMTIDLGIAGEQLAL